MTLEQIEQAIAETTTVYFVDAMGKLTECQVLGIATVASYHCTVRVVTFRNGPQADAVPLDFALAAFKTSAKAALKEGIPRIESQLARSAKNIETARRELKFLKHGCKVVQ